MLQRGCISSKTEAGGATGGECGRLKTACNYRPSEDWAHRQPKWRLAANPLQKQPTAGRATTVAVL